MRTKEQKAVYDMQYMKEKCSRLSVLLNKEHDQDILEHLENTGESFNTYVKRLIREDMNRAKPQTEISDNPTCKFCRETERGDRLLNCSECPEAKR